MVKKINSSEFEQVKNNKAIIVDFSAEWCGPCKMLAPVMEQLSDEIILPGTFQEIFQFRNGCSPK